MRIAIITGEYPPMEGGVGAFTRQLGLALNAQGHEIHILTTATGNATTTQENGLHIYRHFHTWGLGIHRRIDRWLEQVTPDIVNIQYQAAAYQMKGNINLYPRQVHMSGTPVLTTYHDLLPPYLFPKAGPLRQWMVWQLAQYSNGIIVTNSGDYTRITQEIAHDKLPPVRLIPIGSNIAPMPPADYERATWRATQGFAPEDMLIGFFGFLNHSKGIETLLTTLASLVGENYPAHLLFVGGRTGTSDITNAQYADEIDALIECLHLENHVHRTGYVTTEAVSAALLGIDICALPYRDGASLRRGTLHAALAHGNAIVTTLPQDETPQLRNEENVILVPPEDPVTLTQAIKTLWGDPETRARLGHNAAKLAQEFTWEYIAIRTVEFIQTLL
ncbi:MAG: glycosyltransferase family 4 protein [Anaerolineae bacterium]|nr:glycosyltransferase family 4 protein [Anaerolineae bacterium]